MGRSFYDFQIEMGFKEVTDVFQYEQVSKKMENQFIFIYALNLCATNIVFLVEKYKEHIANR